MQPDDAVATSQPTRRVPALGDSLLYMGSGVEQAATVWTVHAPGNPDSLLGLAVPGFSLGDHSPINGNPLGHVRHDPEAGWCWPEERVPTLAELPPLAAACGRHLPAVGDRVTVGLGSTTDSELAPLPGVVTGIRRAHGGRLVVEVEAINPLAGRTLKSLLEPQSEAFPDEP